MGDWYRKSAWPGKGVARQVEHLHFRLWGTAGGALNMDLSCSSQVEFLQEAPALLIALVLIKYAALDIVDLVILDGFFTYSNCIKTSVCL